MLKHLDTLIGFAVVMSVVSLLITIITQLVSTLLGLRGRNLSDALVAMAQRIDPSLRSELTGAAKRIADKILIDPTLSDSCLSMSGDWFLSWKRATALRPEEFLSALHLILGTAAGTAVSQQDVDTLKAELEALKRTESTPQPAIDAMEMKLGAARLLHALNTVTPATRDALDAINLELPSLAVKKGRALIEELNAAKNVALRNLEACFESTQDRARQWFAEQARYITVVAAIVVAFALQLDSFALLRRISSNPELRAQLIAMAPALQADAEVALREMDDTTPAFHTNVVFQLDRRFPGVAASLARTHGWNSSLDTTQWVSNQIASCQFSNQLNVILGSYNDIKTQMTRKHMDQLTQSLTNVYRRLDATGIELLPNPYPKWGEWCWPISRLLGILASAGLLSLGAPFWFNILKSMSNLRPMLAQAIDREKK